MLQGVPKKIINPKGLRPGHKKPKSYFYGSPTVKNKTNSRSLNDDDDDVWGFRVRGLQWSFCPDL